VSVDAVTVGEAVSEAKAHQGRKRLASVPVRPEPPGPRSVVLALARLGLITGTDEAPRVAFGACDMAYLRAARTLIAQDALSWNDERGCYQLTPHGLDLYGPDMRQRPFLTTR
jgi:hypothetical protein